MQYLGIVGRLDSVEWNGLEWWNGMRNKLDTSDWFHLNIDHLSIKTTQLTDWIASYQAWFVTHQPTSYKRPPLYQYQLIFRLSTEMLGGLSLDNFQWSALRNEYIASLHSAWCLNIIDKLWYSWVNILVYNHAWPEL